jgi:uncharacterized BrkB/YihY/UPF0761 family membrane protein
MTPRNKSAIWSFIPETLLYGALAAGFCFGVIRFLGRTLQAMFREHPAEYGLLALVLMTFQGFVLERVTHGLCDLVRRRRKARS